MDGIVLSAGVRSNLLQLQKTSELITTTQSKLATGKRVNTALDNPINYFTAQGLQNRAGDLSNLLDSMSTGINTIQAANNGITAITKLVQSAQALASQAMQTSDTTGLPFSFAAAISMAVIRFSFPSVRMVPIGSCEPVRITGLPRFSSMKLNAEAVNDMVSLP